MTDDALKEWIERVYDPVTGPAPVRDAVLRILTEKADLSFRLHAVKQERDALTIQAEDGRNAEAALEELRQRCQTAEEIIESLGPPVPACPQCHQSFHPKFNGLLPPVAGIDTWHCTYCKHEFKEPTYYRQVTGESENLLACPRCHSTDLLYCDACGQNLNYSLPENKP